MEIKYAPKRYIHPGKPSIILYTDPVVGAEFITA
jgi:hypothetical protein